MCVNSLPKAAPESVAAGSRSCYLLIASPAPYHYATNPHTYADEAVVILAICLISVPHVGSRVVRIDTLRFLAGCRTKRLNQGLSVLFLSLDFFSVSVVLLTRAHFCIVLFLIICVLSLGCSC